MNREEYLEIKNRAWNWYKNGMRSWILATIKDFANAPQWVKDAVCYYQGNSKIDFDFVVDRDDVNLLKEYDTQIDTILRASQRLNFKVNYTKELLEFFEAQREGNEYETIDALCDMIITAINAGGSLGKEFGSYGTLLGGTFNITSVLNDRSEIYKLCDSIRNLGYDPYECLCETMKELETRTGAWNEAEGKWCKDLGAYTLKEAIEKADNCFKDIPAFNSLKLLKEDQNFWLFGEWDVDDISFFDDKTLDESHECLDGEKVKVKKWYKADYSKCKLGEQKC